MSAILRLIGLALYIGALILVVWLVLYVFNVSTGNSAVAWFHHAANWLATWSRHLFDSVHNNKVHALLEFGVPAVVYAAVGSVLGRVGSSRR
jgi:Fe2+ transport system protein B